MPSNNITAAKMKSMCVIEDDTVYQAAVEQIFSKDYKLELFSSVEGYLEKSPIAPDVLLIDYNLPGVNGFDLFKKLKEKGAGSKLILMSTVEDGPLLLEMINKGLRHYVIKDEHFMEGVEMVVNGDDEAYWELIT